MKPAAATPWSDRFGIALSGLCVIQCPALPVALAALSVLASASLRCVNPAGHDDFEEPHHSRPAVLAQGHHEQRADRSRYADGMLREKAFRVVS